MTYAWWCVYMVRCADGSLYTGVTKDVEARVDKHNAGKGAKYLRGGRLPVRLTYLELHVLKPEALKREAVIKKMRKGDKEAMAGRWWESRHPTFMSSSQRFG